MSFNNTTAVHTYNSIHNTLLEAGWTPKHTTSPTSPTSGSSPTSPTSPTSGSSPTSPTSSSINKYIYRNKDPYDEFIVEYTSSKDVLITVPIPFRGNSLAYQKTFSTDNMAVILNYLEIHLGNYR
jgi:hypothetical protein